MKSFWIATVIISCVFFAVIWNTFLIRRASSALLLESDNFTETEDGFLSCENQQKVDRCVAIFEKNRLLFKLSFPREMVDDVDKHLQELKILSQTGPFSDYMIAKKSFEKAVMVFKESVSLSFGDVF